MRDFATIARIRITPVVFIGDEGRWVDLRPPVIVARIERRPQRAFERVADRVPAGYFCNAVKEN